MRGGINLFKIYAILQWGNIRPKFQFISNSLMGIFGLILLSITSAFSLFILLKNLPGMDGWTIWQLLFLNGFWRVAHGLFLLFGQATWTISNKVRMGTMDRLLVRPMNPLSQLFMSEFNISGLGYIVGGFIIFTIAAHNIGGFWSVYNLALSLIVILVGFFIEVALFLMVGTLSFWVTETAGINAILLNFITNFHQYPLSIFGIALQVILTFIIPIAFINYYPSFLILNIHSEVTINSNLIYFGPLIAALFMVFAIRFWMYGIKKYNSTGS